MTKINLDFSTERALGKHLPSIMINAISIENRGSDGPDPSTGSAYGEATDLIITANLIINITKPKDMQDPAAWIAEYLGDLYLYAYISGFENLNTQLENKNFFLKDLQAAYSVPNRHTFNSSTPGFSVIHEYMKEAFITHEWYGWTGDTGTQIRDAYSAATESELAAGLEDPDCIWHYLFYGNFGTTGPWYGGDGWESGGDLDSTKTLYSDILHSSEQTYQFEDNDCDLSFMKHFLDSYLYFLTGTQSDYSSPGGLDAAYTVNLLARKIPLSDFLTGTEPNEYGANFLIQNVYDQEGNELIQISNINVKFEYGISYYALDDGVTDYSKVLQRLQDTDKLFFIGTIGVDTDAIGIEETPGSIYNSYFGNISYEHILANNEVPTQYVETFHISDTGAPYDETPLVNLDGRYHAIEPVDHGVIASKVASLIGVYEHRKEDQYSLKRNIDTLEAITRSYKNSPTILRMLAAYQQSYSPQDASQPSGWFYNDFTSLLTNLSKRVGYQHRLDKKMTRVGIVTDFRAMAINEIYYAPTPKWSNEGAPYTTPLFNVGSEGAGSDDFIPSKWARMARMTLMAELVSDDPFPGYGSDNEQFRQDIWRDLESSGHIEAWLASGFTMEDIEAWVEATTGQMTLREGSAWIDGDTESAAIDDMHDPFGLARLQDYDYVVKNSGHFWFDWEKALYTQSNIAQVLQLDKLGRFFRMRVPYKYFPLLECKMTREELDLSLGLDDDPGKSDWLANKHTVVLKTVLTGDLPGSVSQALSYEVGPIDDSSGYAYGFPSKEVSSLRSIVTPAGHFPGEEGGIYSKSSWRDQDEDNLAGDWIQLTTKTDDSYLKFIMADSAVNINGRAHANIGDVEHSAARDTLIGYGFAPPGVYESTEDGGTGYSTVPHDSALELGFRVRNGYRLMGFEYADLMDDDVAFYNTMCYAETDGFPTRQEALEELNSKGQSNSEYKVEIKVKDTTLAFYTDVFWPFIKESYENFYEYYLFAEEFCSFNNLNGQFNKFFVDAINERYADSSEKRWVRASLVATLLKEILYRSFEYAGPTSEESLRTLLEEEVMEIINHISPEEGNLQALRQFNCRFGSYLLQVNPHADFFREFCADTETPQVYNRAIEISGLGDSELEGDSTDWTSLREVETYHEFLNYLQIDSVIYGDYLLNAQLDDDITFGTTSVHPLGIPPVHLYLTAGTAASTGGGYERKHRILVYAHGMTSADGSSMPATIVRATSDWSDTMLESGWFYLENLIDVESETIKFSEDMAPWATAGVLPAGSTDGLLSKHVRTPLLLDFGQTALTNERGEMRDYSRGTESAGDSINQDLAHGAGTTQFSNEMFRFVTGVGTTTLASGEASTWEATMMMGDPGHPTEDQFEYGRFTFVILDNDTISRWADEPDMMGMWKVTDPTHTNQHLKLNTERLRMLADASRTISLTEMVMGDDALWDDHARIGAFTVSELAGTAGIEGLWFPNWCNLNTTWDGKPESGGGGASWLPASMTLTDWRFYRPTFSESSYTGEGTDEAGTASPATGPADSSD